MVIYIVATCALSGALLVFSFLLRCYVSYNHGLAVWAQEWLAAVWGTETLVCIYT